jgi:hypothetical protein
MQRVMAASAVIIWAFAPGNQARGARDNGGPEQGG